MSMHPFYARILREVQSMPAQPGEADRRASILASVSNPTIRGELEAKFRITPLSIPV